MGECISIFIIYSKVEKVHQKQSITCVQVKIYVSTAAVKLVIVNIQNEYFSAIKHNETKFLKIPLKRIHEGVELLQKTSRIFDARGGVSGSRVT